MCQVVAILRESAFMFSQIRSSTDALLVASDACIVVKEFQRKLSQLTPEQRRLTEKLKNMTVNNLPG